MHFRFILKFYPKAQLFVRIVSTNVCVQAEQEGGGGGRENINKKESAA